VSAGENIHHYLVKLQENRIMKKKEESYKLHNHKFTKFKQSSDRKDLSIKFCNRGKELIEKLVFGGNILKAPHGTC
jgi:hypothetical protein